MMATAARDTLLFACVGSVVCFLAYTKPDPGEVFFWLLRGLLGLAVAALLAHGVNTWWKRWFPESPREDCSVGRISEEEAKVREGVAKEEKQLENSDKSSEFYHRITKPREDAKFRKKEEQFYKQMGQEWKLTKGETLSPGSDNATAAGHRSTGSGKDAARARKLPDDVMNPPKPPHPPVVKEEKRKITMPMEPDEGTPGCVTLVLRTSHGRNHKRRFLIAQTIQELLDFMTMVGYHQNIYQICTSYPRQCISTDVTSTLEDVGIVRDIALNVEGKEDKFDF